MLIRTLFLCLSIPAVLFGGSSAAQSKKVRFIVTADVSDNAARILSLAGSMNNWNPADSNYRFSKSGGGYELTVNLPLGLYEYKLTRGSWSTVETALSGTPLSNRRLDLKSDTTINLSVLQWQDNFKRVARAHTASENVKVIDTTFSMPQLSRTRRIWVYLPPGYQSSAKRYPVIYMHDGQNLFDSYTAGYGEWGVDELMDSLYLERVSMAIIVGIDHGDKERLTEYNPYDNDRFGKGRGDDYADFLAQTLKPYIDKTFRTLPAAKHTAIAGSSMGGLISMYTAARYPLAFGKAGVFSPSFWIAPEIYSFVAQKKPSKQMFYFVAGDLESKEMVPDMKKMYDQLLMQGTAPKRVFLKHAADGTHSEWFWHREFADFYKWIMD
ncbi:alpha/beta hydrolase [Flavihumibacter sp. R14]|nr:alpha/beta hydrolase [Flavihumibacter soli]